jgi:hypothetical protein
MRKTNQNLCEGCETPLRAIGIAWTEEIRGQREIFAGCSDVTGVRSAELADSSQSLVEPEGR